MSGSRTADLLRATQSGDQAALTVLLTEHLPALRAFVRLRMSPLLRAREASQDLVQSTCAELLARLDGFEFRGEAAFRGWLYTAVHNKLRERERALRAQKRDARREVAADAGDAAGDAALASVAAVYTRTLSPSQTLIAAERVRQLEAAFDGLPDDYREVLTLSRIARMDRSSIAAQMGRTEASVRSLLTRALADLAYRLERVVAADRD